MPHIALTSDDPGIRGLFRFRPETALPLNQLVEVPLPEGMELVEKVRADLAAAPDDPAAYAAMAEVIVAGGYTRAAVPAGQQSR
ncbi:hypothetical protein [Planomonospora sp. ID67723]|uniref:hypothetical protein n=1 Tax=Planomonospora sp. ID67723 TaxID=2738134 RepID=UPI001E3B7375|nr:hypothetical protein [Planomonospora sp. ID67723]